MPTNSPRDGGSRNDAAQHAALSSYQQVHKQPKRNRRRNAGTAACHGQGKFCVVAARYIESEEDYERLKRLPGVADAGPISRILVPQSLHGIEDLRLVAANLKADMVLIYSKESFISLVGEVERLWQGILQSKVIAGSQ